MGIPPYVSAEVFPFGSVMIYIYKKLVTVAEAMVATYDQFEGDVVSVEVSAQGDKGHIRLGMFCLVGSTYYPDENQHMPNYDIVYKVYHYAFVDGKWCAVPGEQVMPVENAVVQETWVDDLPF